MWPQHISVKHKWLVSPEQRISLKATNIDGENKPLRAIQILKISHHHHHSIEEYPMDVCVECDCCFRQSTSQSKKSIVIIITSTAKTYYLYAAKPASTGGVGNNYFCNNQTAIISYLKSAIDAVTHAPTPQGEIYIRFNTNS